MQKEHSFCSVQCFWIQNVSTSPEMWQLVKGAACHTAEEKVKFRIQGLFTETDKVFCSMTKS